MLRARCGREDRIAGAVPRKRRIERERGRRRDETRERIDGRPGRFFFVAMALIFFPSRCCTHCLHYFYSVLRSRLSRLPSHSPNRAASPVPPERCACVWSACSIDRSRRKLLCSGVGRESRSERGERERGEPKCSCRPWPTQSQRYSPFIFSSPLSRPYPLLSHPNSSTAQAKSASERIA